MKVESNIKIETDLKWADIKDGEVFTCNSSEVNYLKINHDWYFCIGDKELTARSFMDTWFNINIAKKIIIEY